MKARVRIYWRRRVKYCSYCADFHKTQVNSKFVDMCAEYFEQTDGNVENSFIHSFK